MRLLPIVALLAACEDDVLPGDRFAIQVTGKSDGCHAALEDYHDSFEYRLVPDVTGAYAIYVDEDLLGSGDLGGCSFTYGSLVITSDRGDGAYVRWSIAGEATIALGPTSGCESAGAGWVGTETVQILESTDETVPAGCSYVMDVEGSWLGSN